MDRGFPSFATDDPRYVLLGTFLTMDVQTAPTLGYDLLDLIDQAVSDRPGEAEWEGEGFVARFSRDGVHLQNLHLPDKRGTYTLDDLRIYGEGYWRFIASVAKPEQCAKELEIWERSWQRPHPYRGRLF